MEGTTGTKNMPREKWEKGFTGLKAYRNAKKGGLAKSGKDQDAPLKNLLATITGAQNKKEKRGRWLCEGTR